MERTEGRETVETGRGQRCAGWQADGCAVYWFIRRFSHHVPSSHRTSRSVCVFLFVFLGRIRLTPGSYLASISSQRLQPSAGISTETDFHGGCSTDSISGIVIYTLGMRLLEVCSIVMVVI